MFDLRQKIKIFVANGEVRYGPRVDQGFFPVFSVDTEVVARLLVKACPWASTDSLSSYAKRLEEAHRVDFMGVNKFVSKPIVNVNKAQLVEQHNSILNAIDANYRVASDAICDAISNTTRLSGKNETSNR